MFFIYCYLLYLYFLFVKIQICECECGSGSRSIGRPKITCKTGSCLSKRPLYLRRCFFLSISIYRTLIVFLWVKIQLCVTFKYDKDPDPNPHWFGSLDPSWIWIHTTLLMDACRRGDSWSWSTAVRWLSWWRRRWGSWWRWAAGSSWSASSPPSRCPPTTPSSRRRTMMCLSRRWLLTFRLGPGKAVWR